MKITLKNLKEKIGPFDFKGVFSSDITNIQTIENANENSIIWIKPNKENFEAIVRETKAKLIVCSRKEEITDKIASKKGFIMSDNPRLTFIRIGNQYFQSNPIYGIHPTAVISAEATIHKESYIGPFSYIGKAKIRKGVIIYGNVHIYDNVVVGSNSIIHAGAVIGADGFGYSRNERNEFEKFPHFGGVRIAKNVEIGACTCIDRGTLGNTIIKEGAKIDNLVHIAHNVIIGKHTAVIANSMIGGSTIIDDYSWIAPSSSILNGLHIGHSVTIGMSAVVTKNVPDTETWAGMPAKPLIEYLRIQNHLKTVVK